MQRIRIPSKAFTLIEILVVIGIIVVLLALLVPCLNKALSSGEDAKCKTNMKGISSAFQQFSLDHRGVLPGNYYTHYPAQFAWQYSWIGNEVWQNGPAVPGTITKYIGGTPEELYRCPSLSEGVRGSGIGSNGMFDYVAFLVFNGARVKDVPSRADWKDSNSEEWTSVPVPLIAEEDPAQYLNSTAIEPGHSGNDRMALTHGWANYASTDHSVTVLEVEGSTSPEPVVSWRAKAPSGQITHLGHVDVGGDGNHFGDWGKR